MKKHLTFNLSDTATFAPLTKEYFSKAGFKLISESSNEVSFGKGSILLNMVTFSPLNWKSQIAIRLENETVTADFDITTVGHLTTPEEEKLWDQFIENYKVSLVNKVDLTAENQQHLKDAKKNNWKYFKWALIGAVAVGVPFGILARLTENSSLAPVGAVFGAMAFMSSRINKERNKERLP